MYWMFSLAEFEVFPSVSFEEGVFGSILVSSTVSRRIVLQSASQYLSPVPKQTTKVRKFGWYHRVIITACQWSCWEVMFSIVSVHQSVILFTGGPTWSLSIRNWTSMYRATLSLSASGHGTSLHRNPPPTRPVLSRYVTLLYRNPQPQPPVSDIW